MPSLTVSGLSAGYGDLTVVEDVDIEVGDGEFVAIIGPNGAGKSTLLESVFGLTDVTAGTVVYDGEDLSDAGTVDLIERGMGLVPQEDNVFPDLSVVENLRMGAYTRDELPDEALARVYNRFPVLEDRLDQPVAELSGGQQQMVAIGRALVTDPGLLALDEPSAGLAPDLVQDLFDEVEAINESGTSVLVVEQNAEEILRRADRGYILTQGRIQTGGPTDELLEDEEIRERFFGA